jgi:hypothetical protein
VDREQIDEFYRLKELAYETLRLGRYLDRHLSVPICQFLTLPSFENPFGWDVIQMVSSQEVAQTRLYRSCWRMDLDSQAMSSPLERLKHPHPLSPTIEVNWVLVDALKLEKILSQLHNIQIPLTLPIQQIGCDGTSFELAIGDFFCNARIGWWCDMPEEWKELQPVVTELERLFKFSWAAQGNL